MSRARRVAFVLARQALIVCSIAACQATLPAGARAQVRGEIVGPGATRMPIAVPELKALGGFDRAAEARRFIGILRRDLELSGLFRVIDPSAYIEDPQQAGLTIDTVRFDDWAAIGAKGLVSGGYTGTANGLVVEMRFFDVAARTSSGGRRLTGDVRNVARLAHRMADAVLEYVTGVPGPFDSRIAFVSNRDGHVREVYMMTLDGRVERVTRHNSITMAPSWHPSGTSLLFTSFRGGKPVLYSLDLRSGFDSRIASKLGVNVGGAWSPDGTRILLAREEDGNTDIYMLDPVARTSRRLTTHWGIDSDPSWSPDGSRIVFCSSRSGSPQVYTMRLGDLEPRRLTFQGNYNCAPVWSPDGRWIAYAGQVRGVFQIFVIPSEGGPARQLTVSGSSEDPTWSPDSRYLAFAGRRGGRSKIYMIDAEGRWEHALTDGPSDDSSPSWSGRLR